MDVLVRREGAPMVPGRRAVRRSRPPRLPLLLAAMAVVAAVAASTSTLVQMSGDGAAVRPMSEEQAAAPRVVTPPPDPPASPDDEAEPVVDAEKIDAPSGAAAAPQDRPRTTRAPRPTERPRATRSQERTPSPYPQTEDLELAKEIEELSVQLMKGAEAVRDRGSAGHRRGPNG